MFWLAWECDLVPAPIWLEILTRVTWFIDRRLAGLMRMGVRYSALPERFEVLSRES